MKKIILVALVSLIYLPLSNAQKTTTEIVNQFFATLQTKSSFEALDNLFAINTTERITKEQQENLKSRFNGIIATEGNLLGFEILSTEENGTSLIEIECLAKYESKPVFITFEFYKPLDKWQILNFRFAKSIQKTGQKGGGQRIMRGE